MAGALEALLIWLVTSDISGPRALLCIMMLVNTVGFGSGKPRPEESVGIAQEMMGFDGSREGVGSKVGAGWGVEVVNEVSGIVNVIKLPL